MIPIAFAPQVNAIFTCLQERRGNLLMKIYERIVISLSSASLSLLTDTRSGYSVDFSKSRISVNKCVFNKRTIARFASAVFDGLLESLRLARHTWWCPCISVVQEATHESSWGPLKAAVSAEKPFQGLQGTEENGVSRMRGHSYF